jgi:hypothetical protein
MHVCIYVHPAGGIKVCIHVHYIYIYIYIYIHSKTFILGVRFSICIYAYTQILHTTYMHTCIHTIANYILRTCIHAYIHLHMLLDESHMIPHTHRYDILRTCIHAYIRLQATYYVHAYMHTYACTCCLMSLTWFPTHIDTTYYVHAHMHTYDCTCCLMTTCIHAYIRLHMLLEASPHT